MDCQLPEIDGIEVTKKIRAEDNLKNVQIIFCTSNVLAGDRENVYNAGDKGYIEKPLVPETFINKVLKHIEI